MFLASVSFVDEPNHLFLNSRLRLARTRAISSNGNGNAIGSGSVLTQALEAQQVDTVQSWTNIAESLASMISNQLPLGCPMVHTARITTQITVAP